jgi:hypothetical protein
MKTLISARTARQKRNYRQAARNNRQMTPCNV